MTPDTAPPYYARVGNDEGDPLLLRELWLDTHGTPHDTGTDISPHRAMADGICEAALWTETDTDYQPFEDDQEETKLKKVYVCGPVTQTYPADN